MNNELRDIINGADLETLKILEKNVAEGKRLKDVLRKKISAMDDKLCANCLNRIDPFSNSYTLHFGSDDFKKQAHFCAIDCMEYFLKNLKEMKGNKITQ